jgi:hypothetical protein
MTFAIAAATDAASVSYSKKQRPSQLYDHMGGSNSLQRDDSDDLNGRNMLDKAQQFQTSMADRHKRDVEALLAFRKAITYDNAGLLSNWTAHNSNSMCSWNGIWCRRNTERVVAIILPQSGLSGTVSPSLGSLSLLRILVLSGNYLTGRIPPEIGQVRALRKLDLSSNALSGPIPRTLFNCTQLLSIDLSGNSLTGMIPTELGRLIKLEHLSLYLNALSRGIPNSLGNCTSLRKLWIRNNNLSGAIPSVFRRMTLLQ